MCFVLFFTKYIVLLSSQKMDFKRLIGSAFVLLHSGMHYSCLHHLLAQPLHYASVCSPINSKLVEPAIFH